MFKFIHAADIHLDSPLRGLSRYDAAPVDAIRGASRRAFENLIQHAIEEKVAFILLAGDIYDGDWKDYSTGIFLSQQIGKLKAHHIHVFAVLGNHDAANKMTKALDSPSNMTILAHRKVEKMHLADLGVMIHGRSFSAQHIHDNLVTDFAPATKDLFNIGLLHTSLDGREGHAPYAPCSIDDLRSKGYHYWALGHVHKYELVAQAPWIVFPGCIQGRHIHETGAKGCVLVTVSEGEVSSVEPVALDVLRWVLCRVDVTDTAALREVWERIRPAIASELAAADGRIIAMRIRLEGASQVAAALAADPEHVAQQCKAIGAELAGEDLWIERVENAVTSKRDLDAALADDNPLANLLNAIIATSHHPDDIDGLPDILAGLRQKIPHEALGSDATLNLDAPETLQRIVQEAKQMLVGRLLSVRGDP
ncbi:DNA repair exonuclease [Thiothrix litoralis]|jgi:predicted phosphodiesterase|uniref:DNA repair exonuclease n=1 Tax=Thiothrix litoralis TaxID=2891210 RepID=A0ABX7WZZ7_9GAMM|nr:DNA repair exonuclease [Thiothrix litoralis]QTR47958.1 DNA repair exonuclease [Thiothrix litoralis]